ncbi:nitrate ABC transporter substrate-binding protein [Marinobacter sp. JSM 1782161]|uniref:nitrate ABC transporter substrate-binding protein n=1 Tax=Marinobacter sp. JSM 1782161 TaxID=2685906 RepID=UPI001403D414|nr:nitrate ABC transporter substrate-binding protein [Marinobacter sp. JSM 1782161]
MRMTRMALMATLAWSAGSTAMAEDFIDGKPLSDVMDPAVQDCRSVDPLILPIRTTGVDTVTLFANDYQLEPNQGGEFGRNDLNVKLELENDIRDQLEDYLSCETPIMRGTQGMLNAVADLTEGDDRTQQVAFYQHGFSNGADAIVVRPGINSAQDLSGKTIVIQAYGPHVSYLARILSDGKKAAQEAGQTWQEPTILYTENLMGFGEGTPGRAFEEDDAIDAAFVTSSDARILTSGGKVGTGAEGSVKGARTMLSTRSANRLISEVYVVRADYLRNHRDQIKNLTKALFSAEEKLRENVVKQVVDWEAVGDYLLGDPGAEDEAQQMWRDVETVGMQGNIDWATPAKPRSWKSINDEIQSGLVATGMLSSAYAMETADWNYGDFAGGVFDQRRASLPGFDNNKASSVVASMDESGSLEKNALMEFDINFKPNQTAFSPKQYAAKFDQVLELAATYGGAVITVEGHSDPLNYLKKKHNGANASTLRSIRQSARNLSMSRAIEVRDVVLKYAEDRGQTMDESQFVTLGHGITEPKTGMCSGDPCAPKTEAEWLSNMRVTFRIVNVEAEASTFTPINAW